jgi:hypothetical protein
MSSELVSPPPTTLGKAKEAYQILVGFFFLNIAYTTTYKVFSMSAMPSQIAAKDLGTDSNVPFR